MIKKTLWSGLPSVTMFAFQKGTHSQPTSMSESASSILVNGLGTSVFLLNVDLIGRKVIAFLFIFLYNEC